MVNLTDLCEQTIYEMRGIIPDNETGIEILEIYLIELKPPVRGRNNEKIRNLKFVKALVRGKENYYLQKPDSKTHYVLRDLQYARAQTLTQIYPISPISGNIQQVML